MSVSKVKFADNLVTSRGIILPFLHFSKRKNNGPEMLIQPSIIIFFFSVTKRRLLEGHSLSFKIYIQSTHLFITFADSKIVVCGMKETRGSSMELP
jgi:hypothetical protein